MNKKILIAVAWPYVNGDLHVGHLAGYLIPADIEARFQRLLGNDVLMVSGSDCHGTPITVEADKRDTTPDKIVDEYHRRDLQLFKLLGLSYNLYTKTTNSTHKRIVQELFLDLLNNGFIVKKQEKQYFSEEENKFLPDRYVEGECPYCHAKEQRSDQCEVCGRMLDFGELINPYSKMTKSKVILKETEHYYLDLPKLSKDLSSYIDSKKSLWRKWVYNEAKGWLQEGLKMRPITRDLDWGVEIPIDKIPESMRIDNAENKRIYVWFEAVTGYLSASVQWSELSSDQRDVIFNVFEGQSLDWKKWWFDKDAFHYYFLGQDNVVFHTILWPGQLLGAKKGYHLPDNVVANKFMNLNGAKFSKSRGNIIDSKDLVNEFGVDVVRFFVTRVLPENKETNFTWQNFYDVTNNELVANLGNFINRTLTFTQKYFGKSFKASQNFDSRIVDEIKRSFENSQRHFEKGQFVDGLNDIMNLSHFANKYFNDSKIWEIIKKDEQKAFEIMNNLLLIVVNLSILFFPIMPFASARLRKMLGLDPINFLVGNNQWQIVINFNLELQDIKPLFKKIDLEDIKERL